MPELGEILTFKHSPISIPPRPAQLFRQAIQVSHVLLVDSRVVIDRCLNESHVARKLSSQVSVNVGLFEIGVANVPRVERLDECWDNATLFFCSKGAKELLPDDI